MTDQTNKADAGKLEPRLLFEGMPRALLLIIAVLTYGARKYSAHSWKQVQAERYRDAKLRHMLDELAGLGAVDAESGLLHAAHEISNSLFLLQQFLEPLSPEQFREFLVFNDPPTAHKTPIVAGGIPGLNPDRGEHEALMARLHAQIADSESKPRTVFVDSVGMRNG